MQNGIVVSIVSHGHGGMVPALIDQLRTCPEVRDIVVTRNRLEPLQLANDVMVQLVDNSKPKGFGANHNAAFRRCREPFFCVLNPDVILQENPFPTLLNCLNDGYSVAAPLVLSPVGQIEDSARQFPTLKTLVLKAMGGWDGRYDIMPGQQPRPVDWVAGMFMLFRSEDFARLGGFDECYYLYYEDVDICARAWRAGMKVVVCPSVSVIHDARRASRRNLRHMRWHLASMIRYLWHGRLYGPYRAD